MVGSDQTWSIERIYIKYLKQLGINTELFAAQNLFYDSYYKHGIISKLLYKAGFSSIHKKINTQFLNIARTFKPEIIWIFKGMEIYPKTLETLRKEGFLLVNYNPDNPFYFSGYGSGNKNITDSIGCYDLHLTYDRGIKEKIISDYKVPCKILPFGFELSDSLYNEISSQEEILTLCFIGNPDKDRVEFINQLASSVEIDVYGHGWDKAVSHPNIHTHDAVYSNDFWKTLRKYRVQLNLMRPHNPASHNMRSFEIPGAGGIGLYPDTIDHREYWSENSGVFLYRNVEDCKNKAMAILALSKENISKLRENARSHSLKSGYAYSSRTEQALRYFNELLN